MMGAGKQYVVFGLAGLLLAGCETGSHIRNASAGGAAGLFSCQQISGAFAAYDRDRHSWSALKNIAAMTGLDTARLESAKPASYYEQVKNSANIALLVQGCQPL